MGDENEWFDRYQLPGTTATDLGGFVETWQRCVVASIIYIAKIGRYIFSLYLNYGPGREPENLKTLWNVNS